MNFKKFLAILLALTLVFAMTACGNQGGSDEYDDEYLDDENMDYSADYDFGITIDEDYAGSVLNEKTDYTKLDEYKEVLEKELVEVGQLIAPNWSSEAEYDDMEDEEYGESIFCQALEDDDIDGTQIEAGIYKYVTTGTYNHYFNYCSESIYPDEDGPSVEDIASDLKKLFGVTVSPEVLQTAIDEIMVKVVETGGYYELVEFHENYVDNDEFTDSCYLSVEGDIVDEEGHYMAYVYCDRDRVYKEQ